MRQRLPRPDSGEAWPPVSQPAAYEKALAILVPEAEALVGRFRDQYDPSAGAGVPAHITVNYPFLPGRPVSDQDLRALEEIFAQVPRFDLSLSGVRTFPDMIFLNPEPASLLVGLIASVARRFPESPPYGGAFAEIVPHLTVAQVKDPALLDSLAAQFREAAASRLPIKATVSEVLLMDNRSGRWERRVSFRLSG